MTRRSTKIRRVRSNPHMQFKSDTPGDSECPNFSNLKPGADSSAVTPPASSVAPPPPPPSQPVTLIDTGEHGVSKILIEDSPTISDFLEANRQRYLRGEKKGPSNPVTVHRVGEVRNGNPIFEAVTPTGPATIQDIARLFNELAGKPGKSTPTPDLKPVPWKVRDLRFDNPADDRCAQCDAEPTGEEYTLQLRGGAGYACLHPWCWQYFSQQVQVKDHDKIAGLATLKPRPTSVILKESARRQSGEVESDKKYDPFERPQPPFALNFHPKIFSHKCPVCGDQANYSQNYHDKDWFCRECFTRRRPK
jgi:hypothetical protein